MRSTTTDADHPTHDGVREATRHELAELLGCDVSTLTDRARLVDDLALDSLEMLSLRTWLADRGAAPDAGREFVNVGDVLTLLADPRPGKPPARPPVDTPLVPVLAQYVVRRAGTGEPVGLVVAYVGDPIHGQGDAVEALQIALIYRNNAKYVTGTRIYDQKTFEAVIWIQTASGASSADGIYGPETRKILNWVHHDGTNGICDGYDGP